VKSRKLIKLPLYKLSTLYTINKNENQAAKDYFVFATPTMFLLDTVIRFAAHSAACVCTPFSLRLEAANPTSIFFYPK
jgi:hypothetical protein